MGFIRLIFASVFTEIYVRKLSYILLNFLIKLPTTFPQNKELLWFQKLICFSQKATVPFSLKT